MKFLLNSQIKIFSLTLSAKEDGGFEEAEVCLGSFYCHARLSQVNEEENLVVIIRSHKDVKGRLKVLFEDKTYLVFNIKEVAKGFLKLICK